MKIGLLDEPVRRLAQEGRSYDEVARVLSVSTDRARRIIVRLGFTPVKEAPKPPEAATWDRVLLWANQNGVTTGRPPGLLLRVVNIRRQERGEAPFAPIKDVETARQKRNASIRAYRERQRAAGTQKVAEAPAAPIAPEPPLSPLAARVPLPLPTIESLRSAPDRPATPQPVGWRDAVQFAERHYLNAFTGDMTEINRYRAKRGWPSYKLIGGRLLGLKI